MGTACVSAVAHRGPRSRASLRLHAVVVSFALTALPASAAGFGLELGGGYASTDRVTANFAIDARIPSEVLGSLEIRSSAIMTFPPMGFALAGTLLPRYRTPYARFSMFSFTVAGGIGALVGMGCAEGVCGFSGAGPVIEVSPTLTITKTPGFQPFIALNGLVASVWTDRSRVFLNANLAVGVAFDFSDTPKKTADERLLPAVTTQPVQPSSGEPDTATPTLAPTAPVTPPQDEKPAAPPPSQKLLPGMKDDAPKDAPPLTPSSAPETAPSP